MTFTPRQLVVQLRPGGVPRWGVVVKQISAGTVRVKFGTDGAAVTRDVPVGSVRVSEGGKA